MAIEILGRLPSLQKQFPGIQRLVDAAKEHVLNSTDPSLVPIYPCLPPPGQMLKESVFGIKHIYSVNTELGKCLAKLASDSVTIWDLFDNENIHTFCHSDEELWELTRDNETVLSSNGKHLSIYSSHSGMMINRFHPFLGSGTGASEQEIGLFAATRKGSKVYCTDKHLPKMYIVDMHKSSLVKVIDGKNPELEQRVAADNPDADLSDSDTRKQYRLPGHCSPMTNIILNSDDTTLITTDDSTVCFWDTETDSLQGTEYLNSCENVALSTDGTKVVLTSENKLVVFNTLDASISMQICVDFNSEDDARLACPRLSRNNRYVVCAVGTESIHVYKVANGALVQTFSRAARFCPTYLNFDQTNQFVLGDGAGGFLRVWHIPTGQMVLSNKTFTTTIDELFVAGKQHIMTLCSTENTMKVLDLMDVFMSTRQQYLEAITDTDIRSYESAQVELWRQRRIRAYEKIDKEKSPYSCGIDLIDCMDRAKVEDTGRKATADGSHERSLAFNSQVPCVKVTNEGKHILTVDSDGVMEVWNTNDGSSMRKVQTDGCQMLETANDDNVIIGHVKKKSALVSNLQVSRSTKYNEKFPHAIFTSLYNPEKDMLLKYVTHFSG